MTTAEASLQMLWFSN